MPETTYPFQYPFQITLTLGEDGDVQKIESVDLYLRRDDDDVVLQSRLRDTEEQTWAGFVGLLSEADKADLLAALEG